MLIFSKIRTNTSSNLEYTECLYSRMPLLFEFEYTECLYSRMPLLFEHRRTQTNHRKLISRGWFNFCLGPVPSGSSEFLETVHPPLLHATKTTIDTFLGPPQRSIGYVFRRLPKNKTSLQLCTGVYLAFSSRYDTPHRAIFWSSNWFEVCDKRYFEVRTDLR